MMPSPPPLTADDPHPVRTILRRETRLAVEHAFERWQAALDDHASVVDLKNAVDHLFQVELALASTADEASEPQPLT